MLFKFDCYMESLLIRLNPKIKLIKIVSSSFQALPAGRPASFHLQNHSEKNR
jgi:hypothetical protein